MRFPLPYADLLCLLVLQALPDPSQCLFLRLLQRRGPWFRQNTLNYPEASLSCCNMCHMQARQANTINQLIVELP